MLSLSQACACGAPARRVARSGRPFTATRPLPPVRASSKGSSTSSETPAQELRRLESDRVRLRSEAEAPFRSLRLVLYGFAVASAGMASLISVPQFIAAAGGAPNALPLEAVLTNIGVNLGALGLFGWLFSRDWKARDKQMARLLREEALASLPLQLVNGKRLRLGDLQGSSRPVLAAGTPEQVSEALAAAEPYREQLQRRGVLIVPLPIFDAAAAAAVPAPGPADLRWRATPLNADAWRQWFSEQLALAANASPERGLYIGLRLDGRVRASGMGPPPWQRFAVELAPLEGEDRWTGFLDGFDGDCGAR